MKNKRIHIESAFAKASLTKRKRMDKRNIKTFALPLDGTPQFVDIGDTTTFESSGTVGSTITSPNTATNLTSKSSTRCHDSYIRLPPKNVNSVQKEKHDSKVKAISSSYLSLPWDSDQVELLPVPKYHPIHRMALTIECPVAATIVTQLVEFLRKHSIQYVAVPSHVGRMDCLTQGLLEFTIQLWQGHTGDFVILEIDRHRGCAIELHGIRCCVSEAFQATRLNATPFSYKASKRLRNAGASLRTQPNNASTTVWLDNGKASKHGYANRQPQDTTCPSKWCVDVNVSLDSIDICMQLLKSNLHDQNRLGMEALCALTNSSKVSKCVVDRVCHLLIYGQDSDKEDGQGHPMKNFLLQAAISKYFCQIELPVTASAKRFIEVQVCDETKHIDEAPTELLLLYEKGRHFGSMHFLALRSLAQALEWISNSLIRVKSHHCFETCNDDESISRQLLHPNRFDPTFSNLFWRIIYTALTYNLKASRHRPFEAAFSIKCLRYLIVLCSKPVVISFLEKNCRNESGSLLDIAALTERAHQHGLALHAMLEQEATLLLHSLRTV